MEQPAGLYDGVPHTSLVNLFQDDDNVLCLPAELALVSSEGVGPPTPEGGSNQPASCADPVGAHIHHPVSHRTIGCQNAVHQP